MRNFKKVLSLVLVIAMVFSFGITGASALVSDFSDAAQIKHKSAVDYLTELGAIQGYDDGTYRPENTITRAEFCRLVAIVLSGGVEPKLDPNAVANFSDTRGHWAEPEIVMCFEEGIINGDQGPGGTFRPEDTITLGEAAKAVLVAAGYDTVAEGFMGANWLTNVTVVGAGCDPKLFSAIESVGIRENLTRDAAAQLVWNIVRTGMVEYEVTFVPDGQGGTVIGKKRISYIRYPQTSEAWDILGRYFSVDRVKGIVAANEHASISGAPTRVGTTRLTKDNTLYEVETSLDELGTEVELFVKREDAKNLVIGSAIPTSDNTIVEIPYDEDIRDTASDNDVSVSNSTKVVVNYNEESQFEAYFGNTVGNVKGLSGIRTRVVDNNGDGTADYIFVTEPTLDKVMSVSGNKVTFRTSKEGNDVDNKDIITDLTLAKDDFVLITPIGADRKFIVEEVDIYEGTIASVTEGGKKLKLDGTEYAKSNVNFGLANNDATNATVGTKPFSVNGNSTDNIIINFNDDYTFYLDADSNIIAFEVLEASAAQYAIITEAGSNTAGIGDSYIVKAYLSDGSPADIFTVNTRSKTKGAVSNESGVGTTFDQAFVSTSKDVNGNEYLTYGKLRETDEPVLARYTINSNDEITLYDIEELNVKTAHGSNIKKNQSSFSFNANNSNSTGTGTGTANSKTIVFYVTQANAGDKYKVTAAYVGNTNISEINESSNNPYLTMILDKPGNSTSAIKAMAIKTYRSVTVQGDVRYAYLTGFSKGTGADDIYIYDVVTEDGVEEVESKDDINVEGFYNFGEDSDGYATFEAVESSKITPYINAKVSDYDDGIVSFTYKDNAGTERSDSVTVPSDLPIYLAKDGQIQYNNGNPKDGVLESDYGMLATSANILVNDDGDAIIIVTNTENKDRGSIHFDRTNINSIDMHNISIDARSNPGSFIPGQNVTITVDLSGTVETSFNGTVSVTLDVPGANPGSINKLEIKGGENLTGNNNARIQFTMNVPADGVINITPVVTFVEAD